MRTCMYLLYHICPSYTMSTTSWDLEVVIVLQVSLLVLENLSNNLGKGL